MSKSTAKSDILTAIRNNLWVSKPHDALRDSHHHAPPVPTTESVPSADAHIAPLDAFTQNLRSIGGHVTIAKDLSEAMTAVQSMIDDLGPKRIAVSDAKMVDRVLDGVRTDAEVLRNAPAGELFTCDIGITSAQFAIVETGTLVLESEKEFARLTSLVPDVHICILDALQMRDTMADVLDEMRHDLSPAVTFITGPSRTSDIELTVAIGVHGPRELHVVLVDHASQPDEN